MPILSLREASGWWRTFAGVLCALLIVVQAWRILLVPPPVLEMTDGQFIDLSFDDPRCRADSIIAASTYDTKWSHHPDDQGVTVRCVSAPFVTGDWPQILVRYAGDPAADGVHAGLDVNGDSRIDVLWGISQAARQGWLLAVVPLPEAARRHPVQLVIEDQSTLAGGWLRVRDLAQFAGRAQGISGPPPWPKPLAALCTALLAVMIFWCGRSGERRLVVAGVTGIVAVEFLQVGAFFLRDDFVLIGAWADGIAVRELVSYYDQFAPLFLALYAGAIQLTGSWYGPLQLVMLAAHAGVVLVLWRLLVRHGFPEVLSLGVCLLYATAWSHIDVVPWFMEICFLGYTALTLVALERTAVRIAGVMWALWPAIFTAGIAPLVFAGGVVAPWLCFAYVLVFAPRDRVALAAFFTTGLVAVVVVLMGSSALGTARDVASSASLIDMLRFVADGALASSLASLLGLRGAAWFALAALALTGLLTVIYSGPRRTAGLNLRSLAFGAAWLVAAYVLQAVVRTNTGYGDAMSFRYTYFGMTGAAFTLAAWLQPLIEQWRTSGGRSHRLLGASALAAVVIAVGANTWAFHGRSNDVEREHFDINRQYFALTHAALTQAVAERLPAPVGIVPRTLFPGNQTATPQELTAKFRQITCYLDPCASAGPMDKAAGERLRPIWAAMLQP